MGIISSWQDRIIKNRMADPDFVKSVAAEWMAMDDQRRAQEQRAVVNDQLTIQRVYDTTPNVREREGATFAYLQRIANDAEPVAACIETRVQQTATFFAGEPDVKHGYVHKAGIQVKMTNREAKATGEDLRNIQELTHFLLECGFTEPPRDERPVNWQPGLEYMIRQLVRDSLTFDWAAIRRWKSKEKPDKFPIVCFAAEDAARIRRTRRPVIGMKDGVIETEEFPNETGNAGEIMYVKQVGKSRGDSVVAQYTAEQMFTWVRNPRSDDDANGYGFAELERCLTAADAWIFARDYNISRFRNDSLPRGLLAVMGQLDQQQFSMFKMEWQELLQGLGKRWKIPIVRGLPQAGSSVNWVPFDLSSRDMEYNQFLHAIAIWIHTIYRIHPEETGFDATNPYRPPLSQASPETKMEYSQDGGLAPILRSLENLINREIVWKLYPDRRYTFHLIGTGQYDQMQDVECRTAMLTAGLTTPRMQWNELDLQIPEATKDSPFWDLPMPPAQGIQLLMTLQQEQAQEQAQMQQEQMMQAQASQQQAQMQQGQPQGPGGPQMPPGGDPGAQGGPPPNQAQGPGMGGAPAQMVPGEGTPIRPDAPMQKAVSSGPRKHIILTKGIIRKD